MKCLQNIVCFVSALLLVLATSPAVALADVQYTEDKRIETYTYLSTSDPKPENQERVVEGDITWTLESVTEVVDNSYTPEPVYFMRTHTAQVPIDERDEYVKNIPTAVELTGEANYTGTLPLTDTKIEAVYGIREYQADVEQVITGLSSNDVSLIPATATVTVPATGHTHEFNLAYVSWSVEQTYASGAPKTYTATCTYRGIDTTLDILDHYDITATYYGEGTPVVPVVQYKVTATYHHLTFWDAVAPIAIAVATTAAAGGAAVATRKYWLPLYYRRRPIVIYKREAGKLKKVCSARLLHGDAGLELDIPVKAKPEVNELVLRVRHASFIGQAVVIYYRDTPMYKGILEKEFELYNLTQSREEQENL